MSEGRTPIHFAIRIARLLVSAVCGAGLASVAHAAVASRSLGPPAVTVAGFEVPVLSALFGLVGVVLTRKVAPLTPAEQRLSPAGRVSLTILLAIGVLALVITGERRPIVALTWSVGLGYSGLAFVSMAASAVRGLARILLNSFVAAVAKGAAAIPQEEDNGIG